jgi:hypothetical protein
MKKHLYKIVFISLILFDFSLFGQSSTISPYCSVSGSQTNICLGQSVDLTANISQTLLNQATYIWSTDDTTSEINVSPTQTTTYKCIVEVNGQI